VSGPYLAGLGTGTPKVLLDQRKAAAMTVAYGTNNPEQERIQRVLYRRTGVHSRASAALCLVDGVPDPGGPRILTAVSRALDLPDGALAVSRGVLADHGNMSSPTILFILERRRSTNVPRPWVALAFGPGLSTEAALLE